MAHAHSYTRSQWGREITSGRRLWRSTSTADPGKVVHERVICRYGALDTEELQVEGGMLRSGRSKR